MCDLNKVKALLQEPLIFDGRNIFDEKSMAEQGFTYYSVGRPAKSHSPNTTTKR